MDKRLRVLRQAFEDRYGPSRDIYADSGGEAGYWSNIDKKDQKEILGLLKEKSCLQVVRERLPEYEQRIFNPLRAAGLKLLQIEPNEIGCIVLYLCSEQAACITGSAMTVDCGWTAT